MQPEWQKISAAASHSQKRRSTITRRSSLELVRAPLRPGQPGVRARCAKGMSFFSVVFIFLDLMVLPLYAFGLEYGVLDGITIVFWSILLLVQALKLVERSRKRPATWILEASVNPRNPFEILTANRRLGLPGARESGPCVVEAHFLLSSACLGASSRRCSSCASAPSRTTTSLDRIVKPRTASRLFQLQGLHEYRFRHQALFNPPLVAKCLHSKGDVGCL